MADEEQEPKKQGLPIKMIAIGLVAGLLIGGGGLFFLKGGDAKKKGAAVEEEESPEEEVALVDTNSVIYELEPFIVNLADTPDLRYLKLTVKLDLLKPSYVEAVSKRVPQIRDTLLILLSSKNSSSIRTVEGKMELRDEILQRINGVFEESKVRTAYFTDFVTQ